MDKLLEIQQAKGLSGRPRCVHDEARREAGLEARREAWREAHRRTCALRGGAALGDLIRDF